MFPCEYGSHEILCDIKISMNRYRLINRVSLSHHFFGTEKRGKQNVDANRYGGAYLFKHVLLNVWYSSIFFDLPFSSPSRDKKVESVEVV